jgi:peptide/nickel transport system permease protein
MERLRLTGVPEWRVVFRHALPAAVIPCSRRNGAVCRGDGLGHRRRRDLVFSVPGLGQELVRGVVRREVHVVQAIAHGLGADRRHAATSAGRPGRSWRWTRAARTAR